MSDVVTLILRTPIDRRLQADAITPDRVAALSSRDIAALPVWFGRTRAALGDLFEVNGERGADLRVEGDLTRVDRLGAGMTGGRLTIEGDIGDGIGTGMAGGSIEVHGRAGDDAGSAMTGGKIRIAGDAGDRLAGAMPGGRGMAGGEVLVGGNAGHEVAASCRRGLVVVAGDVGDGAARQMIAGSLLVFGRAGVGTGALLKRGTVVSVGGLSIPETFRYACTYRPPHLRMTLVHLNRQYGWPLNPQVAGGRYRRYCGDLVDPGKGEILVWESP